MKAVYKSILAFLILFSINLQNQAQPGYAGEWKKTRLYGHAYANQDFSPDQYAWIKDHFEYFCIEKTHARGNYTDPSHERASREVAAKLVAQNPKCKPIMIYSISSAYPDLFESEAKAVKEHPEYFTNDFEHLNLENPAEHDWYVDIIHGNCDTSDLHGIFVDGVNWAVQNGYGEQVTSITRRLNCFTLLNGYHPTHYGYDEYGAFNLPSRLYQMSTDSTVYRTIDFIERNSEQPFFVNVWLHEPHTPHYPKEKYMEQFAHLDEQQQVYAAILAKADADIGLLMTKLKELNIDENTLVIFSSDNGPEYTGTTKLTEDNSTGPGYGTYYSVGETGGLKGRKRALLSGGVRTPFIARCPSFIPEGQVDRVSHLAAVDILPTFLELAGVALPGDYMADGESIVPALKGESFERKKTIYWEWLYASINRPHWPSGAIQEGNWKLVINEEAGRRELYNLAEDWAEQENVIDQYPDKATAMEYNLNEWKKTLPKEANPTCFSQERKEILENQE